MSGPLTIGETAPILSLHSTSATFPGKSTGTHERRHRARRQSRPPPMSRPPSAPARLDGHGLDGHRSVSAILSEMAESWPSDRITLGDFIEVLGNRGHGLVMLTLTLPNVVPVYIPGLSAVTGDRKSVV